MSGPVLNNRGFTPETGGDGERIAQQALGELARMDAPMLFVIDQQTRRHLYLDGPCERLLGLTREQLLADADAWQRAIYSDDKAVAITLWRDLELHGQVTRVLRFVLPDGVRRTVRAALAVRRILGRTVVAGSVVEQGLGEQAQDESGVFRLAVASVHDGVAVTDAAGCYLYLNRAHLEMFAYERIEQLAGQSWRLLYGAEEVRYIEETVYPEVKGKGVWRGRLRAKRRDGTLFHQDLTLSLLPSGGVVCNCRDVTDQVEMAQRLEASETMFRTFLNSLPVAVTIRSLTGTYEFVNRATEGFLDVKIAKDGRPVGMEACLVTDPTFAYWAAADQRVATSGEELRFDFPLKWGGRDWVLDVQKLPLRIGSAAITHVCTLVNDVTEQRRLEMEAEAHAQQREGYHLMQREFIAMVSHEFRTPLTSIRGVHFLLTNKTAQMSPELSADCHRLLKMQEAAIGTLTELVDQVLLLNRLEHMSLELTPAPVLLADFVRRIVGNIDGAMQNERLMLALDVPEDFSATLDEPQMRAVFENLISNALKYAPVATKVRVEVKVETDCWELTVADRGRGIPPADQGKLFTPFHRASNVGQVPGTGLGLTIVRRVVDYHRGTVALTSVVGEGTTFKLSFPREFSADRAAGPTTTALPLSKLQPIKPSSP